MALGASIYKAELDISNLDRNYYANRILTVARHPSETEGPDDASAALLLPLGQRYDPFR